jgi:hypothetical protein
MQRSLAQKKRHVQLAIMQKKGGGKVTNANYDFDRSIMIYWPEPAQDQ